MAVVPDVNKNQTLNNTRWNDSNSVKYLEDELADSCVLTCTPLAVAALVAAYLVFVLYLGPRFMKRRNPFNLMSIMMVYNLIQVIYNTSFLVKFLSMDGVTSYIIHYHCYPLGIRADPIRIQLCNALWHYTVLKILDLLDTVFFVLRKKQTHVSFLHVYHHAVMVILSFVALKYIKGEQVIWIGILNAAVHVVMYSYYFLAALGERVRGYLWWKRYVTVLQMVQFVLLLAYYTFLSVANCNLPKMIGYAGIAQTFVFLCLFINFYSKSYSKNKTELVVKKGQ